MCAAREEVEGMRPDMRPDMRVPCAAHIHPPSTGRGCAEACSVGRNSGVRGVRKLGSRIKLLWFGDIQNLLRKGD